MSQAKKDDHVKVHYTGKLADGTVFDSSLNREPLEFILGAGQMIPGFDKGINGMTVGEEKTLHIPAAEAYGEHDPAGIIKISRDRFPQDMEPEIGQKLHMQTQTGHTLTVAVVQFDSENVSLDANHELAGKDLIFDVKLVSIN
ncbi:MAG: peptidylprolyl isomerase [Candidatus Marinimicrobia bacterium]|nr:peptidylprolyl isomerase [Candidatus Neomarinimicrobiota bacterium]